jgi:hypothetical protein
MSRFQFTRGAAAVELALVTIPIVLITLGTLEFSFALNQYHSLSKRVHDAARYLTQFDRTSPGFSTSIYLDSAFNLVQGADVAESSAFRLPTLEKAYKVENASCTLNCVFICSSAFSSTPPRCTGQYYWPSTGVQNGIQAITLGVYGFRYTPRFFPSSLKRIFDFQFPVVAVTLPHGT